MLLHDKKLAAAWHKKDKRKFEELLIERIKKSIIRDAEENGWTMDAMEEFIKEVSKE